MRGIVAKRIRNESRIIAKDTPTKYNLKKFWFNTGKVDDEGEQIKDFRGTIFCTGYRRIYQDRKKAYKNGELK